ncbi:MAG TPA: hypothetical protein PKI46_00060 [Bacteroidales bacterium]|nr:hypothetical protein [Bacteroidales bacterium]
MKKFFTTLVFLFLMIGVAFAADNNGFFSSLVASIWTAIKTEFLPTLKNDLFPLLFNTLQALIVTVIFAVLTFFTNWFKSKIDNDKIDSEIDSGNELMKTLIIEALNSPKYKELKEKYIKGEITATQFATQAGIEFKDPILNTVENKSTKLGKALIEILTNKFGDGKKYLSAKLEELLADIKKK